MKCIYCEETIKKNEDYSHGYSGKPAHDECVNSEYPSTLVEFLPDGTMNSTSFDENFIFSSDKDEYDQLPYPITKQVWVSSDAWRGYTDWKFNKKVFEVGDGWVTSWPDETTKRKFELGDIFEKLKEGELKAPCPLYWVFGVTSNIFSTASVLLIDKHDKKIFKQWVEEINGGIEEFSEKFS